MRNHGVDALRTFAVVGMMASHTSRLIVFESRPAWSSSILLLEPMIPSLFLFLVGVSLTYSIAGSEARSENKKAWYRRQAKRALGLWLISALFFALEEGIRLPDVFIASGILCTIAYAIVSIGALLLLRRAVWGLSFTFLAGTVLFLILDQKGMRTFYLVSGNSPFFPLWLFAAAGALWGLAAQRLGRRIVWIGIATAIIAIALVHRYGVESLFAYPVGRSDAARILAAPLTGGSEKSVAYYNLRPLLSLFCLCVHLSAAGFATLILSGLKDIWASRIFSLGRKALEVYVLHLFLLAMLVVNFGLHPLKTAWQGDLVLAGVVLICLIWSILRQKWHFMGR